MGYYSFYRIIKDILRNFKKNKLIVIIGIVILCLFICNKVFAVDLDYKFPNNTTQKITLPSWIEENDYNYFFYVTPHTSANSTYWSSLIIAKGEISLKLNGALTTFYCNEGIYNFPVLQSDFLTIKNTTQAYTEPTTFSTSVQPFNIYNGITSSNIQYIANTDIKNYSNSNIIFPDNSIKYPVITTSLQDLQTLNFDTISVSAWDWSDKDLYILFYDRTLMNNNNTQGLYPKKEIKLTTDTSYYIPEISTEQNVIYWIANDNTGLNFKIGGEYEIRLAERVPQSTGRWFSWR